MPRTEDASCAICMDQLFHLRDDLDEVLPIATPDCGHVFHEKCLLSWFTTQAQAYVAQARDHGVSVPLEEAPAECPSCRSECFADPETGDPSIHRLFINWGEGDVSFASSQMGSHAGSSPVRRKDREVLGLARRARNLTAEVGNLSVESNPDDVAGTLRRAGTWAEDAVDSKAAEGFKAYTTNLSNALDALRQSLETHPLIQTLQGQLTDARRQRDTLLLEHPRALAREVQKATRAAEAKAAAAVKVAERDREAMQRELEKERVARAAARKAFAEERGELERRALEAQSRLGREREDKAAVADMLDARTRSLRACQQKLEKRARTIAALEAQLAELRQRPTTETRGSSPDSTDEVTAALEPQDKSLEIDMDSFERLEDALAPRRSATARTYAFELDADGGARKRAKIVLGGERLKTADGKAEKQSAEKANKAFIDKLGPSAQISLSTGEKSREKRKRESKYFPSAAAPSSPERNPFRPLGAASSTSSVAVTQPPTPRRPRDSEVIVLDDSSPDVSTERRALNTRKEIRRTTSAVEYLGVADKQGRPRGSAVEAGARRRVRAV